MSTSRRIAGLLGPSLMMIVVSEFPLVQPDLYAQQTPPVVYLSGVLLFIAGLAIVRDHNRWVRDWTSLVTLSGWAMLLLGAVRMFAASACRQAYASAAPWMPMTLEGGLFLLGLFQSVRAYRPTSGNEA